MKSEKESLETALYELQQTATKLEARKEALEAENQELLLAKEALAVDLQRVRKEKEIEETKLQKEKEVLDQELNQTRRDGEVKCGHTRSLNAKPAALAQRKTSRSGKGSELGF